MMDGYPMLAKIIADGARQLEVIFHQQDVHGRKDYATAGGNAWHEWPSNLTKIQNLRPPRVLLSHGFHVRSGAVRPRSILAIFIGFACSSCALQPAKPPAPVVPPAFEQARGRGSQWPDENWYHAFPSHHLHSPLALPDNNRL